MNVRPALADEWSRLREIRLASLVDAPDAFGQKHDEVVDEAEEGWRAWIAGWPGSRAHVALVAEIGERWIGMAVGDVHEGAGDHAHLFAMWVEPSERGTGVGRTLVEAVLAWARRAGASAARLTVTESNPAAVALYERCGFTRTSRSRPLRDGSPLTCVEMEREL